MPMSSWITDSPIVYPALEAAHIAGIAVLIGSLVVLELRVWGAARELPVPALARLALTVTLTGFGLALFSGVLMFAGHAAEMISNRAFLIKMALLVLAGANAGLFHARGGLMRLDGVARAQTALSLGLWAAVIVCGRWIAYR